MQPNSRHYRKGESPFALLCRRVEPFQAKLATHYIYTRVRDEQGLRVFMKNHVFAVWDFMTLTKSLQRTLTCVDTPWLPTDKPLAARMINEIVLGEETDEVFDGEYISHYTLYLRAMGEIGADPRPMLRFEQSLRGGRTPAEALAPLGICDATKQFVLHTLATAQGKPHEVAASLLLAREDLIPVMFDNVLKEMDKRASGGVRAARALRGVRDGASEATRAALRPVLGGPYHQFLSQHPDPRANFRIYLQRHVALDGEEHGPMGRAMLMELCGDDELMWEEATLAARGALEARIALWDGVLRAIERSAQGGDDRQDAQETWGGRDLGQWLDGQRADAAATPGGDAG